MGAYGGRRGGTAAVGRQVRVAVGRRVT